MKIERVKKKKEFLDTLSKGNKYKGKLFSLYCGRHNNRSKTSIGVVITKKKAPKATQRNYLKRVIYSFFNKHTNSLKSGTVNIVHLVKDVQAIKRRKLSVAIREDLKAIVEKTREIR